MTLVLDLPAEVQARLEAAARREGLAPAECAGRVLAEHLPSLQPAEDGTAALFARWAAEDGTDDPEEIEARTRDWEELKANLEANPVRFREWSCE